jgi:uncharacterized membrane protein YoaK (UPF0700 family)
LNENNKLRKLIKSVFCLTILLAMCCGSFIGTLIMHNGIDFEILYSLILVVAITTSVLAFILIYFIEKEKKKEIIILDE